MCIFICHAVMCVIQIKLLTLILILNWSEIILKHNMN